MTVPLAVQELREAGLLATADMPQPPTVTAAQLYSLNFLNAVCHESLRLMAPVPGSARVLGHDTEVGIAAMRYSASMTPMRFRVPLYSSVPDGVGP